MSSETFCLDRDTTSNHVVDQSLQLEQTAAGCSVHKDLAAAMQREFRKHLVFLKQKGSSEEQLVDWFSEILNQLPRVELLVMALFYREELNFAEIAEVLERSESEVCRMYTSVLDKLCTDFSPT